MTTLAWVLVGVIVVLVVLVIGFFRSHLALVKRIEDLNRIIDNAQRLLDNERTDRDYYQRAHKEAIKALDEGHTEQEDMKYLHDSLLRAADDDPTT